MSAYDQLNQMLQTGRVNTQLMNNSSASSYYNGMNQYMKSLYDESSNRGVAFEEPNGWSQVLMNMASQNNSWSAEQAQKQMDFQERMSNTAHQREIEDLKAAGLNPVLSAKFGGASTPSGASATADTSLVSSIVGLMNKMLDVETSNAQMNLQREIKSGSGSGSGSNWVQDLIAGVLDLIPGVNSNTAKGISGAVVQSGLGDVMKQLGNSYAKNPIFKSGETHGMSTKIFGNQKTGGKLLTK